LPSADLGGILTVYSRPVRYPKGLFSALKTFKFRHHFLLQFIRKAGANLADILKFFTLVNAQQKRAKLLGRALVFGKAANNHFLPFVYFDFEPIFRAVIRQIGTTRFFGHDAFQPYFARRLKKLGAVGFKNLA
jgi:hypothetical protein